MTNYLAQLMRYSSTLLNNVSFVVRGLDMPTVTPPPQEPPHWYILFIRVSWIRKKDVNRKNIGMNFILTPFFHRYPPDDICVYRVPNLWGYGWYIVHYISVDCLIINSYITFKG